LHAADGSGNLSSYGLAKGEIGGEAEGVALVAGVRLVQVVVGRGKGDTYAPEDGHGEGVCTVGFVAVRVVVGGRVV